MRNGILLLAIFVFCIVVTPATAGWFGASDEEVLAIVQKVFQKEIATFEDFLALDLSTIESANDAKVLAKLLDKFVDNEREALDRMLVSLEAQERTVDRFFGILYCKEIHDALWEQTRRVKQDAYRKALSEYKAILVEVRKQNLTVRKGSTVYGILRRITKKFKAIE